MNSQVPKTIVIMRSRPAVCAGAVDAGERLREMPPAPLAQSASPRADRNRPAGHAHRSLGRDDRSWASRATDDNTVLSSGTMYRTRSHPTVRSQESRPRRCRTIWFARAYRQFWAQCDAAAPPAMPEGSSPDLDISVINHGAHLPSSDGSSVFMASGRCTYVPDSVDPPFGVIFSVHLCNPGSVRSSQPCIKRIPYLYQCH